MCLIHNTYRHTTPHISLSDIYSGVNDIPDTIPPLLTVSFPRLSNDAGV
ncbi:hypothetical protein [Rubritalea tangerina]